ncbi:MAG: glycosyltransferase [Gammaproteobacteria bacterium]|nr:glycosyltransferase [Gammaproteobacteria bacterium]
MTMNVLYLTPWFPASSEDPKSGFILDSIQAQEALGVTAKIAHTISWKPKKTQIPHQNDQLKTYYCLSIPRHYGRFISNWLYILRLRRVILKLIKRHNIHLINAHTELPGMLAVRIGKVMKIPVVVTLHGIDTCPRACARMAGKMIDKSLRQADRVIVVGKPLLEYYKPRLSNMNHFKVVNNGFLLAADMHAFNKKAWSNTIKIVSVSNLEEGKGIDITLRALATLKKQHIFDWHYTIVGDGSERKNLENLVKQLQLERYVSFAGLCAHASVYQYLRAADVFCLPSYREAFGIAYLEAMAYGLLAIGVQGEGPEAFIDDEKTGLLVKPRDMQALMELLKSVFERPIEMQKMAEKGRLHVLSELTYDKHAEHLMEIYKELLG